MVPSLNDFSVLPILVTVFLISVSLYLWSFTRWHYWKVRGVPYLKPVLPVFGSMYDIMFFRSLPDISSRIYKKTEGLPYVGIYAFHTPILFVRDLDLIAKILVNDFNYFEDRGFHYNNNDSLGRNLIHQNGHDWKFTRAKLSPNFNIGKVKSMLPTMKNKSEVLVAKLETERLCQRSIEAWDVSLRYTTDVLTLSTFGVDANSLQIQNEQFREIGKHLLGVYFIYHVFIGSFFPKLHKLFSIPVAKRKVTKFFHTVLQQVINYRENNKCDNKDFVQTLIQMKEESASSEMDKRIPKIDDNFIVAQAFIFFLAGYETPGNILACSLYEIAKHQHIQNTVYTEVVNTLEKHEGEVTFDALQDMKYLRQVISEVLRKYTPLNLIFRRCTKDYTIPGTSTLVEKGTLVLVPLKSIHEDPDYYPDPEVFDPERFSEENSKTRHIAASMPFGVGPRFCPAVLYSHIKIRTALVYILRQFEVCVTDKTPSHIQPSPVDFLFVPKNGIPLTFKKRQM